MELRLIDAKLEIERVRRIRTIKVQNYTAALKFHFPSGAIKVGTYYAARQYFESMKEFILYVLALPYMDYDCYRFPDSDVFFELKPLSEDAASMMIAGSFDSLLDFSRNGFLKFSLADIEISSTYQLKSNGVGQTLFFATPLDYVCFYEEPID